ncbi:MAG: Hpt domain-containing protein [Gammaproteobacteria bacterium]|nr:Hpt domain-containing protein [Gammaproteobacteria bacterium]
MSKYLIEQEKISGETADPSLDDDLDPELVDVFIEEAEDILEQLSTTIPSWKIEQDSETLTDIRRHFHTLKGSGRMAGADVIGELAWSIEHLLNHVLDGAQRLSTEIVELVDDSYQILPDLVQRFSVRELDTTDTATQLVERANVLFSETAETQQSEEDELKQIFFSEATQHIATFKDAFNRAESPFELNKELLRSAHSLKGCANIAQITPVAAVATKLDQTLRVFHQQNINLDEQQFSLLSSVIDGLEHTISSIGKEPSDTIPTEESLLEQLEQMLVTANTLANENDQSEKQLDPEFLAVFLEETDELLANYTEQLQQLQQEPENNDIQHALYQTLDSLIENAEHAELDTLSTLYQTLRKLVSTANVDNKTVSELLDLGYEHINTQIECLMQNQPTQDINAYLQEVETALTTEPEPGLEPDKAPSLISETQTELFIIPTEEPELLEAFTEECAELLESSGNAIKYGNEDENDTEAVICNYSVTCIP